MTYLHIAILKLAQWSVQHICDRMGKNLGGNVSSPIDRAIEQAEWSLQRIVKFLSSHLE